MSAIAGRERIPPRRRVPFAEAVRYRRLGNGAEFFILENHFNPTIALSGSLAAGPVFGLPGRRLVASVTAGELIKGTSRRSKLQIAEALESRAASLSFGCDATDPVGLDIGGSALARDAGMLLELLVEVLTEPAFPAEELEKEKKRLVGAIRQQQDQPSARAYEAAMRAIYPPDHPFYRRSAEERIPVVESLSREELESFYQRRFGAETLRLVVVGDVDAAETLDALERLFSAWRPGSGSAIPPFPPPPAAPGAHTIRMPDKASADVVLAEPSTLTRTDPEYIPCVLANSALGQSSLTSRLGVRVRDVEGLTYGIHSSFTATHLPGPFLVSVTVRPDKRDAAVSSARDEIERFLREGMTEKELVDEKSARSGKFQVDLASNSGIANAIDAAVYYGLGLDYLDRFPALVASVTREQANAAFGRRVHPDLFTIASAGSFD